MIVDCVSDTHGHLPKLEGGDLLIVAGDLTARDTDEEYWLFNEWIKRQKYKEIVVIGGNHDNGLVQTKDKLMGHAYCHPASYLCDSGTEFEYEEDGPCNFCGEKNKCQRTSICGNPVKKKLKIWGSPWTKTFPGMNPHCMAFTKDTEEELDEKFSLIPKEVDILITHSPPFAILDQTEDGRQVGSASLMAHHLCATGFRPKLWVWGHIHEAYGLDGPYQWNNTKYVNASHVNERYQPVNKPIRVIL